MPNAAMPLNHYTGLTYHKSLIIIAGEAPSPLHPPANSSETLLSLPEKKTQIH